jgi:predicted TIM-barrel fold metal-dependent hydrolase
MSDTTVVEPDRVICDPHHHLFVEPPYLPEQLLSDLAAGHRVRSTVYIECRTAYRPDGPEHLRPVGETEFVVAQAVPDGVMGAIIAAADLALGDAVGEVLDAHAAAAPGRFRGIRYLTSWDPDPAFILRPDRREGALLDPAVHRGIAALGARGLVTELFPNWHQLDEMVVVARLLPDQLFVLDHMGGPLVAGGYAARAEEIWQGWREKMAEVAQCPNIVLKVGGFGMERFGSPWSEADRVPGSAVFVDYWREKVDWVIDAFGPERCIFESNFPVDGRIIDYVTLWNALKVLSQPYSPSERTAMLRENAERVYQLTTSS